MAKQSLSSAFARGVSGASRGRRRPCGLARERPVPLVSVPHAGSRGWPRALRRQDRAQVAHPAFAARRGPLTSTRVGGYGRRRGRALFRAGPFLSSKTRAPSRGRARRGALAEKVPSSSPARSNPQTDRDRDSPRFETTALRRACSFFATVRRSRARSHIGTRLSASPRIIHFIKNLLKSKRVTSFGRRKC